MNYVVRILKERVLQNVVHRRASRCMEERGGIVQPIQFVCMDEIVRIIAGGEKRREERES